MRKTRSWRTERNRDTAVQHLDLLAFALEQDGWRYVKIYSPEVAPVRMPLLRIYGADRAVLIVNALAVPGGGWAFHEAPRKRGGFLCHCGGDAAHAAQIIGRFLRDRPR